VAAAGEADEEVADALDPDAAGTSGLDRRGDRREGELGFFEDAKADVDRLGADRAGAVRR
jgi:hypothetical protein